MEDARKFLEMMVDPTIADFADNPRSPRHALMACITDNPRSPRHALMACIMLFHVIDYLDFPNSSRQTREAFCEDPDFLLVDRIANAAKHVVSGHPSSPTKKPLDARSVVDRPPAFWDVGAWDVSRWDDVTGGVTLIDDASVDVLAVVMRARAFIDGKLGR